MTESEQTFFTAADALMRREWAALQASSNGTVRAWRWACSLRAWSPAHDWVVQRVTTDKVLRLPLQLLLTDAIPVAQAAARAFVRGLKKPAAVLELERAELARLEARDARAAAQASARKGTR